MTDTLKIYVHHAGKTHLVDVARRAAPFFALKGGQAEAIIVEVSAALKGWQNTARKLGMTPADITVYATAIQTDR